MDYVPVQSRSMLKEAYRTLNDDGKRLRDLEINTPALDEMMRTSSRSVVLRKLMKVDNVVKDDDACETVGTGQRSEMSEFQND